MKLGGAINPPHSPYPFKKGGKMLGLSRYRVGSRIVANVDIDVVPWDAEDCVAEGDHGGVVDVDPETGDLIILMDRLIPALVNRQNRLFISSENLYRIKLEVSQDSFVRSVAKKFTIALAASLAFVIVLAVGNITRQTHHHAYENRFPNMATSALASNGCNKRGVIEPDYPQ